jgi:hypothetical protein
VLVPLLSASVQMREMQQHHFSQVPSSERSTEALQRGYIAQPHLRTTFYIQVIHNPETFQFYPQILSSSLCELDIIYEGSYSTYQIYDLRGHLTTLQVLPQCGRNTVACIVHAVPLKVRSKDMTELMNGLKSLADSIF